MREVADVHRELFAEHAELYGENVRDQDRALPRASPTPRRRGRARSASATASAATRRSTGVDLLLTPTLGVRRAARPTSTSSRCASRSIRFTFPFNALGWPALALPCGPAEDGLPASVQLVGRPGEDALVLAAGAALESALAGW